MSTMSNEFERIKDVLKKQIIFGDIGVKFEKNKRGSLKISISGLAKGCRNPILAQAINQSILSNVSKQIPKEKIEELQVLQEKGKRDKRIRDEFEEKFREIVIDTIIAQLRNKLESEDIPTPIFPTSVALSETPNYYIIEPREAYNSTTKIELLAKLTELICGRCGQRIYGLYVPEEEFEAKEMLKAYVPDFYNVNIIAIAGGWKNKFR